ncbi:YadA-like family protein [Gallibacterium anatis]|uniref:YadA-like family protein n=1 Tax=Gallibacterium anatis TaxID=750 RepID=UPI0039FB9AEC
MKKTTLAIILSGIFANAAFATETAPTYVDITINNIKEDTGIELGTNSRARGDGSIATGKNSVAIGKNAVATGGNETKDTINQKLNENKQRLQEIVNAEKLTNTLLKDLQNIRKVEADVIEAGERVKQVRKAKATAYDVWQQKQKAYNDEVANSAAFLKEYQGKIDDLNSRLQGVSQLQDVNISSDEGLTNAATQLKSIAEQGTTLNLSVDFYKDYVSSYYRALGDIRQNKMTYDLKINYYDFNDNYSGTLLENVKNPYKGLEMVDHISSGIENNYSNGISFYNPDLNKSAFSNDATIPAPEYSIFSRDIDIDVIPVEEWDRVQVAAPQFKKAFAIYFNNTNDPFLSDEAKQTAIAKFNKKVDYFVKSNEIAYYQGKYEETKDTRWLDRKAVALNEMTALKKEFGSLKLKSVYDMRKDAIDSWKKENIDDVLSKNKITTNTLTSELQKALGINKDSIKQKEAEIEALKKAAEQAKNTYDNTNPSEADLALSQRYDEIMSQLTAKANELKASQERLEALKEALTLNDLTNVGENAIAVGTDSLSTGTNSIAVGTNAIATGENSIAIGKGSAVTGTDSIAIGTGHIVIGNNAGTFGDPNTVYGDNSYAIGNNNTIGSSATPHTVGTNTFVLGNNVTTTANNAVILGAGSVGKDNTVSVGKPGAERQIINVAAGTLSSTSTDAVNGSQLQGVKDDLLTEINKKGAAVKVINGTNTTVTEGTEGNLTTYAVNVSSDAIKEAVQNDLNGKADVDAGNITGSNIGKWQEKLGNGTNTKGDKGLITGDTLYNVTKDLVKNDLSNITDSGKTTIKNIAGEAVKVKQGTNITVSSETKDGTTTYTINAIGNGKVEKGNTDLVTGDTVYNTIESINSSITNKSDTALSNITDDGKTVIRNLAKRSVKVINGTNTTVAVGTDGDATTYSVNVSSEAIKGAVQSDLDGKANSNASNLTETDKTAWKEILGDGEAEAGNKGLINGDTFNTELNKKADKSDITNINTDLAKKANIDASNINVAKFAEKLGTGIVEAGNASLVTGGTVATALENKADSNLSNITNTAKTVIKNLAKDSVKVVKGTNTTVTTSTDGETTTYAVNVSEQSIKNVMQSDMNTKANTDASNIDITKFAEKLGTGTVSKNDTNLVSGKTVYLALQNAVLNGVDVANKANKDASNLSEEDKIAWQESLGNGKAEAGNKGLVTGDTLNSVLDAKVTQVNKTLDSKSNTDASNIDVAKYTIKLTTGRIELGNKGLVNGDQVHNYVQSQVAEMGGRTLAEANSYTDYRIGSLKAYTDKRLKDIRDEARAGVASAMAMGAIPMVPNKRFSIGAGAATYHGQNAVAIGLKVKTENDKAVISLSGSASSNGDFGASAGFAFGF